MFSGVQNVLVALLPGTAEVKYDSSKITSEDIAKAIQDFGFNATEIKDKSKETLGTGEITLKVRYFLLCKNLYSFVRNGRYIVKRI